MKKNKAPGDKVREPYFDRKPTRPLKQAISQFTLHNGDSVLKLRFLMSNEKCEMKNEKLELCLVFSDC